MSQLRIHSFQSKSADIKEWEKKFNPHFDAVFSKSHDINFADVPWTNYTDDALGIDKNFIKGKLQSVRKQHGDFMDIVSFNVPTDHWQNGDQAIWGWHLGRQVYGYEVIINKMRPKYYNTAWHETWHTFDNIVYAELGYRLVDVLGYDGDFDEVIVHAKDPEIDEYDYSTVAEEVAKHVAKAIAKKRGDISRSAIKSVLASMRKTILRIQDQTTGVNEPKGQKKIQHSEDELKLMAKTVWGEASSESRTGRRAVAHVIRNRVRSPRWPSESVSAVIMQPHQFSVWNPLTIGSQPTTNFRRAKNVKESNDDYFAIKQICQKVLNGQDPDPTLGADHYHTSSIKPGWSEDLKDAGYKVKTIGSHVFYYNHDKPDRPDIV